MDIVIRLLENKGSEITVSELVVYGNLSMREKMWQG